MTLIDKADAHEDDLIRRGDALAAIQLGDTVTRLQSHISAIPRVDADPVCTGCVGTGITYQTERRCACQPTDAAQAREAALKEAAAIARHYAETDYCSMGYPEDGGIAASGTAHTIEADILALIGEART